MSSWRSSWSICGSRCSACAAPSASVAATTSRSSSTSPSGAVCLQERDAAEDDLRRGDLRSVVGGDRRHDDEDAVGRERAPVAEGDVVGVADVDAVDEDHPGAAILAEPRAACASISSGSAVADGKIRSGSIPTELREVGVQAQAAMVAVERASRAAAGSG